MNKLFALVLILVSLMGCAHTVAPTASTSNDKRINISTVVSDTGLTGMASTAEIITFRVTDPATGKPVEKEVVQVTHSTPLGRELVTLGLGAVTPALIYRDAIRSSGCKSNCGSSVTAIAGAEAANQAVSTVSTNVMKTFGK